MSKFHVTIEEQVAQTFVVEADRPSEARRIAREKYKSGEFVIESSEAHTVTIGVIDPKTQEFSEWEEI